MRLLIALKIVLRIVGAIFSPVALRGLRGDLRRLVAPRPGARLVVPSVPVPRTTSTLSGILEGANEKGIKLQGLPRWVDYGVTFRGSRASKEDLGKPVELVLIHAKSGPFVRSIWIRKEARPALVGPSADRPVLVASPEASEPKATPNQIDFVFRLARPRGITERELDALAQARFEKSFRALSEAEMSQVITFMGGYPRRRDRKRR